MDVLSDVLATVRLSSAVHICPELSAPWGISFPAQTDRAVFYVLSRGSCYLEVEGGPVTLLAAWPQVIHITSELAQSVPWLEGTLRFLSSEANSSQPGAEIAMARLSDVLFIQMLRAFIAQEEREGRTCDKHAGMLRALVDPDISKALALMHQRPHHPWTVAELARGVGMSRTGFAVRFKEKAGVSPLDYLTQWRMQKAGDLLRQ